MRGKIAGKCISLARRPCGTNDRHAYFRLLPLSLHAGFNYQPASIYISMQDIPSIKTKARQHRNTDMPDASEKAHIVTMENARASSPSTHVLSGSLLVAAITSVCSSGFLLFGYDQGVMSGVVVSQYWLAQMGHPSTIMVSTITALYDVGAIFGAIGAALLGDRLGRKRTLMLGCVILIVGSILMASCFERIQMIFGRILTGLGIGFITSGMYCKVDVLFRRD